MYRNIGKKIKEVAKLQALVGILASIMIGILYAITSILISGILIIVIGSILSWVSSFVLYGFGELVDNSQKIAEKL